jgi:excisionase family DNA binding protein
MRVDEMTFDKLPEAVAYLIKEVAQIKELIESKQEPPPVKRVPIDIDEACQTIGKAKPTLYALVRKRMIPCYKNGKKLYFFEDELLEWIAKGKKKTLLEISAEVEADYKKHSKGIRR